MNTKLVVVFLLSAILFVSVTASRPGKDLERDEAYETYDDENKRACKDVFPAATCRHAKSVGNCSSEKYKRNCAITCGAC
uniref:U-actitoxin-Oulsp1 n=1 Tax=Oulactis sp. TaxID=2093647 RepID=K1B1_OULSP|nr:RecName: Full=U-actitoxin-Oulsp1; Short=U-AITX-Oulsp1; AltName: Full=OspTx2a; Flags: Precursor [Oulactis sp. MM-2018]SPF25670.1 mRNA for sea anemone toxin [Oulactis sp. MM-2018]